MIITLTSDFGYKDPFVGIMKGVIAGINAQARIIDLSHGVAAQDIMGAALLLRHSVNYFPPGSIHVAVVDPGVGSERRPILIEAAGNYFVGPDNGIFSLALAEEIPLRIIHLSNALYHRQPVSRTFHGRDIFAPVAAYLSLSTDATAFGDPIEDFRRIAWPEVTVIPGGLQGEIVYIDGYGNLFTNIGAQELQALPDDRLAFSVGAVVIQGLATHYAAGATDSCVALINSWGLLEIAVDHGNAQRHCGARVGDKIQVRVREDGAYRGGLQMSERLSWDRYFMTITRQVAERSTCTRAKVGAVIVRDKNILATGYNGAPAGMPHCTDLGCLIYETKTPNGETEQNCFRTIHAEMNAIAQAAKNGSNIKDAAIYITHTPCIHCLKVLVNTGIKDIYYEKPYKLHTLDEILSYTQVQLHKVDLPEK